MFGGGFGNRTTSAFGQNSTFGKPSTSFATPGFGTGSTSLFGQQTQPSTSLFGSTATAPTFGQQTTSSQSFGGFGQGTSTSIFGSQQPTAGTSGTIFGAQTAAANPTGTGLFGSSGTTAFGSNPGFGAFGSSTTSGGLFGQTQPPQTQSSSLFGQTSSTGSSLFGTSSSAFGVGGTTSGTTIKFNPVTGTDTLIKNGATQSIQIKHHCITCMREYEAKSLEELRFEDYVANRKGPSQGTQTGAGLFGSATQPSLFSSSPSTSSATTGNLFGSSTFGQSGVFGQTSIQSNNSLFSKSNTTAPFGSTTTTQSSGFGGFGQNTSLFGGTANQAKPAFGATQPASGSLFGGNMNTNNAFGAQQNSSFNFGSQQQNQQGIGLFGTQQNKFGGFNAPSQTTSNFTFGTNTNPAGGTSLFGAKPAGSGFGVTSTTPSSFAANPFGGNTAGTSGGLFSGGFNKPQTSGFSFGQTSNTSTLGGTNMGNNSLFGNNAAKPSGGLFSSTGSSSTGLFSGTGFGTNTGLGGSTNTSFGGMMGFGSGMMGGNAMQSGGGAPNILEQIQILTAMPYGNSPLYKYLRPASGKTDELLKPFPVVPKLRSDSDHHKVSTHINNVVPRKAHCYIDPSKKSLFDKIDDEMMSSSFSQQRQNPRYLKLKPKAMMNKNKVNAKGTEKAPDATYNVEEADKENRRSSPSVSSERLQTPNRTTSSPGARNDSTYVANTMNELTSPKRLSTSNKNSPFLSDDSANRSREPNSSLTTESAEQDEESEHFIEDDKSHACNVKLQRSDYFTIPTLDDLDEMVDDEGRCIVKNFTIGRRNYGNVVFYDAFDVAGLDLDSIVFFRYKEVEIYPNDDIKPPVGVGLNRQAQVTLDRVWPMDKTTREIIKEPERLRQLNFEAKLKRASAKMNAQFIEYRPLPAGSWVFEVDHFSKYGLDESDDEDGPKAIGRAVQNLPSKQPEKPITHDLKNVFLDKGFGMTKKRGLDGKLIDGVNTEMVSRELSFLDENDEMMTLDDEPPTFSLPSRNSICEYSEFPSPTEKLLGKHDSTLHKVQLMKASFYVQDELPDAEISLEKGIPDLDLFATGRINAYRSTDSPNKNILPLLKTQLTSQFPPPIDIPVTDFADEEYKPPVFSPEVKAIATKSRSVFRSQRVLPKYRGSVFATEKSVLKSVKTMLSDTGLYFGRHFRIGWSNGLSFVCLSTGSNVDLLPDLRHDRSGRLLTGRTVNDLSPNVVTKLQLSTEFSPELLKNVENHLNVCLKASDFIVEDGVPLLQPQRGVNTLHEHCEIEQLTGRLEETYERQVWELMVALWGNIPGLELENDRRSHRTKVVRKSALSKWLKTVISTTSETSDPDPENKVLLLLARGALYEACQAAVDNDDVNLSLLISQIGGNEVTRSLMEQQLKQWHESEADRLIDTARLKVMTLVAGHMLFISSKGIINTCEHLDWKQVLAVHLWYITRPSDSLVEALSLYESAYQLKENAVAFPGPTYVKTNLQFETSDGREVHDLCFHLMKLYSRRSYPLERVLNPIAYTSNVLDYRLSWFVMTSLRSLEYDHLSVESEYSIHSSFAAQLEINGLWHWAVFVLLHIRDVTARRDYVQNIIDKNVQLLPRGEIGLTDKENFIYKNLRIPLEWIFNSKAVLAISSNKMVEAAWYYIKAKQWYEAHEIIMNNLLRKAIINEKYEMIEKMLEEIAASECTIKGWNHGGAIVFDYFTVLNKVNFAITESIADVAFLDQLQPLLSTVCSKIKLFPTSSPKERLCQAEISKRMIQLIRILLNLQYGKQGMSIRFVVSLIDQLPLPEDYKQQELQEIISWWIDK